MPTSIRSSRRIDQVCYWIEPGHDVLKVVHGRVEWSKAAMRPPHHTLNNITTARASMAWPSPTGPIFSAVFAFTLTCSSATPIAVDRR